ncbi:Protein of unknown function [Pyronema omphalodes CBS 100304]|uniref:Uncharacterized protein n=1 Tax=Pyronema omphalodes (strain CBS 100304) TaxID=1076935 RepID=U4LT09_PYROM|nr:Protein of unknown function [Pyronema omphalodes CBS 100304]
MELFYARSVPDTWQWPPGQPAWRAPCTPTVVGSKLREVHLHSISLESAISL